MLSHYQELPVVVQSTCMTKAKVASDCCMDTEWKQRVSEFFPSLVDFEGSLEINYTL